MWGLLNKRNKEKEVLKQEIISSIKEEIMKGGNTDMVNDEFSELDDEALEVQEQEVVKPVKRQLGKPPVSQIVQRKAQVEQVKKQEPRYVSVHQPAVDGVIDILENKYLAVDLWDMLCNIKNDLEEIKRAVGV